MRHVPARLPALFLLLLVAGASLDAAQAESPAPNAPSARSAHTMTYDETHKVVLLFGGSGAARFGDLWAWDGHAWTRLSNTGPAPREDAILVHDTTRRRTVLFGGRSRNGTLLADTWEWDGAQWSRRSGDGPGGRLHAVGAFDRAAGCLRVYGGVAADDTPLTDTWEWDGVEWSRVAERGATPERLPNRMAYDAARGRTLLVACDPRGRADGTLDSESWEWDGAQWLGLKSTDPTPAFSPIQDLCSLGEAGGVLLLDGGALQGHASTWVRNKDSWARLAEGAPSPRNGHALAYDAARNRVVLFGGFRDGQDLADTWEWDGARWLPVSGGPAARAR